MSNLPHFTAEAQVGCLRFTRITAKTDTVVTLARRDEPDYRKALLSTGASVVTRPRGDEHRRVWWWPFHINNGNFRTWAVAEKWKLSHGFKVNRHDIAVDLEFATREEMLRAWEEISGTIHLKHINPKAKKRWKGTTLYLHDTVGGGKPVRTLVVYEKRRNVLRIELRFQNSAAVRANGLDDLSPQAMSERNLRALIEKHICFRVVPSELIETHTRRYMMRRDLPPERYSVLRRRIAEVYRLHMMSHEAKKHRLPVVTSKELIAHIPERVDG